MNTQEPVNGHASQDQNGGKILNKATSKNPMRSRKYIALIAHDNCKRDLVEWADANKEVLRKHMLFATATTGQTLIRETGLFIFCFKSGALGGDQQVGAKIAEGSIDFLIFFWDPLQAQPHAPDIKALLRLATVWNIPVACNRATADFLINSPLMSEKYDRFLPANELAAREAGSNANHHHREPAAVA